MVLACKVIVVVPPTSYFLSQLFLREGEKEEGQNSGHLLTEPLIHSITVPMTFRVFSISSSRQA